MQRLEGEIERRTLECAGIRNDGLLNINVDDFFQCRLPVPTPEEQAKLADILDLANQELTAQEDNRVALRRQKRGLMQKLLTGEWRVDAKT